MTPLPLILPLPGNERFAQDLAAFGGEVGAIETRRFPDGETYLRLLSPVAGRAVDLVATLAGPDPDFLRLAFAADAARTQGRRGCVWSRPILPTCARTKPSAPARR
ncbi:hypothetical protein ACFSKJ_22960 [Tabrizicola soli]|uniref:hypothetical protein n=1 Tax=Tabrizicola soli TaxID=2185115 RepID=UPI00362E60C4